jgi:hypothetical protein
MQRPVAVLVAVLLLSCGKGSHPNESAERSAQDGAPRWWQQLSSQRVYLLGNLTEENAGCRALWDTVIRDPDLVTGFPANATAFLTRNRDHQLVYLDPQSGIRIFVPDTMGGKAAPGVVKKPSCDGIDYPVDPTANDGRIETPACPDPSRIYWVWLRPDDEKVIYTCTPPGQAPADFHVEGGGSFSLPVPPSTVLAFGRENTALLVNDKKGLNYYDRQSGLNQRLGFDGAYLRYSAVRPARSSGFNVVANLSDPDNPGALFRITAGGVGEQRGRYSGLPADYRGRAKATWTFASLDGENSLFVPVVLLDGRDVVLRFPAHGGNPLMVYDEGNPPSRPALHIGAQTTFVTGR